MGRERSRSRSRSRCRESPRDRSTKDGSRAIIARLEARCERLRAERDEAVLARRKGRNECDRLRMERDEAACACRKAQEERDDAFRALLVEHARQASSPPIRQSYLKQRVVETVNKLQPQWQVASLDLEYFEPYSVEVSDQLEFAYATGSIVSVLWPDYAGAADVSVCEVDMSAPDSSDFKQINSKSGCKRRVRREMVPLEQRPEDLEDQRPPPVYLEKYPKCWLGSADMDRVEVPPDSAVGTRLLEFMLSSLVECSAASMNGLEIKRVERVENHLLWENYQRYRYNVVKRMDSLGDRSPTPLSQRSAVAAILDGAGSVEYENDEGEDALPEELCSRVLCDETSEMWLFHGTRPSLVDTVTTHGLDPRRSNMHGLYGAGSYFADSASKSHQYSKHEDEDGCRRMLLCRVTMGDPFLTDHKHQNERLPPENPEIPGRSHDSIFAETGVAPGMNGSAGQKHNEYVVFHPDASYPEYIIHYAVSTKGIKEAPIPSVPLAVQQFLRANGLEAWTTYFGTYLPNQVQTVALARSITAQDLQRLGSSANMRLDAKTIRDVLNALKK